MNLATSFRPISHLKTRTARLVREVATSSRPVVITQHGRPRVVVMDVRTYDRWQDALALLRMLAQSEADFRAGRTGSTERAFRRFRSAVTRARRRA